MQARSITSAGRLQRRCSRRFFAALWLFALLSVQHRCGATTKGLNQIVTPDVQPFGLLSLGYQQQDPYVGYPSQLQFEYGVLPRFELALGHCLGPKVDLLNAELAVVEHSGHLLSVGFSNWSTTGSPPQPYVEAGYYYGLNRLMTGMILVGKQWQLVLGWGYQAKRRLLVQLDYQAGSGNSTTAGFTYNITNQLQVNPAVFAQNDAPHHLHGYLVLTWNVQLAGGQ